MMRTKREAEHTGNAGVPEIIMRFFSRDKLIPLAMFALLSLVIGISNPMYFTWGNWQNMLMQVSNVGIIALGAMIVVTSGGLDFTAGEGVSLAGTFAATTFVFTRMSNPPTIIAGIIMGSAMGAVNGLLITKMRLPPFIATLSMMTIIKGALLFLAEGSIIHIDVPGSTFTRIGQGVIPFPGGRQTLTGAALGMPIAFLIFMGVAVAVYFLIHRTKFGQAMFAMGGNEEAARLAGVKVDFYRFWVYVAAGTLTGIGAVITLARVASIGISLGGTTLLLDAVAAAVIGGTSVSGGRCTVFGVVIGTFIVICITSALIFLNVDPNWREIVKGLIILVALGMNYIVTSAGDSAKARAKA